MQRRTFAAAAVSAACWPAARAQAWPARPFLGLLGFASGGIADYIALVVGY